MTMSDPIADMLTRIRNASLARHSSCDMPFSKMKWAIAEVLRDEGYIDSFEEPWPRPDSDGHQAHQQARAARVRPII